MSVPFDNGGPDLDAFLLLAADSFANGGGDAHPARDAAFADS